MKIILEPVARPYLLKIVEDDKKFIQEEMDKIWNSKKKEVDGVKGFRKGKIPRDIAEKSLGFGRLYNSLIDTLFHKSLKEINKQVVEVNNYAVEAFSKDFISIKVLIEVKPEVLELNYKGVRVEMKEPPKVTSEMIDRAVEAIRSSQSELKTIEKVEMGSSVVMDFEGFIDGKPFKGGKAIKHKSELNPGAFIPGFVEQIVGMKIGEEKEINVTFPEKYQAKELEGKTAMFKIKVHEASEKVLPELNDEFAKTNGYDTLEELIKEQGKILKKNSEQQHKAQLQHNVLSSLIKEVKLEPLPEVMITKTSERMFQDQLRYLGMKEEDYFKKTKGTKEKFLQQNYFAAKNDVIGRIILEHIVEKEGFKITEEDKEEYLKSEAERLGIEIGKLKESVPTNIVEENLKVVRAYELICDEAVIIEPAKVEKPQMKEEVKNEEENKESISEPTKKEPKEGSKEEKAE